MSCSKLQCETGYESLTEEEAICLRSFLAKVGTVEAAKHFGLSRQTITAAAAGCAIQTGSRLIIRTRRVP